MKKWSLITLIIVLAGCSSIKAHFSGHVEEKKQEIARASGVPFYADLKTFDIYGYLNNYDVKEEKGIDYIAVEDFLKLLTIKNQKFSVEYKEQSRTKESIEYVIKVNRDFINFKINLKDNKFSMSGKEKEQEYFHNINLNDYGIKFLKNEKKIYAPITLLFYCIFNNGIQVYKTNGKYYIFDLYGLNEEFYKNRKIIDTGKKKEMSKELKMYNLSYFLELCKIYYPDLKSKNINLTLLKDKYYNKIINSKNNSEYDTYFTKMVAEFKDGHTSLTYSESDTTNIKDIFFKNSTDALKLEDFEMEIADYKANIIIRGNKIVLVEENEAYLVEEINNIKLYDSIAYKRFSEERNIKNLIKWLENINIVKNFPQNILIKDENGNLSTKLYYREYEFAPKEIDDKIGYFYIPTWMYDRMSDKIDYAMRKLKNKDAIILDIRWNEGGYLPFANRLISYFLDENMKIYTKDKGKVYEREIVKDIKDIKDKYTGKVVLLTNKGSYSASNYFAAVFKQGKLGTIIGDKTFGGGYLPGTFILPDSSIVRISSSVIITDKDGDDFEGGVSPDIEIRDRGIPEKDDVLDGAIEFLRKNLDENKKVTETGIFVKIIGEKTNEYCKDVCVAENGDIVAAGYSQENARNIENRGDYNIYIIRIDKNGNVKWQKKYGKKENTAVSYSIAATKDGGFIIAGESRGDNKEIVDGEVNNNFYTDFYAIKIDGDGNQLWERRYGGKLNDAAFVVKEMNDGSLIFAGKTESTDIDGRSNSGKSDIYVVKTDNKGIKIWDKSYGNEKRESVKSIAITTDGGLIICGTRVIDDKDNGSVKKRRENSNIYIIRTDESGNMFWDGEYGGEGEDIGEEVKQTSDGGFVVAGKSNSRNISGLENNGGDDLYLIKLDREGNVEWQNMYGGKGSDIGYGILEHNDSYIISGWSNSTDVKEVQNNGGHDAFLMRTDTKGKILWKKMYGGWNDDEVYKVVKDKDNNFISAGFTKSGYIDGERSKGMSDFFLIKFNENGEITKKGEKN